MDPEAMQCQFCWRVQDNGVDGCSPAVWADLPAFLQKYHETPHARTFSEGYCPQCQRFYGQLTQDLRS
ncbi:hypothetical protein FBQ96_05440 [Nitrospirales bacterium NOB]|nr:MAG: hypothetical protein UZ03_NOB001003772 [Nitrospira sp. OLB3]MBV6469711.1 hypothetical protein [Nitrospirota bacterium]MCE7966960.1 hypothetical protein [Nitrospira sp. NTP2]MCK6494446.1 hypothetical protein [Nitrospira sp.]MDL1889014.1 hypothetical protein [Nitrospirales bacterium NOB]MEB2340093.1 hypothetical protein [Nitrospirales bacterium]